ncbi:hypothetical protein FRC00_003869, partial [Tulasnella sp. 408]
MGGIGHSSFIPSTISSHVFSQSGSAVYTLEERSGCGRYTINLGGDEGEGFPKLVPEIEEGNVEYKLKLIAPTPARFTRLVTQLKYRLLEGGGQALYEIG